MYSYADRAKVCSGSGNDQLLALVEDIGVLDDGFVGLVDGGPLTAIATGETDTSSISTGNQDKPFSKYVLLRFTILYPLLSNKNCLVPKGGAYIEYIS